jgi:plastocyanin
MKPLLCLFLTVLVMTAQMTGTVHQVTTAGFTFSPASITVSQGDTVQFVISSIHSALQVSKATWDANGTSPPLPGGFAVPFGGGSAVLQDTGIHYYICQNHGFMGMKGTITVLPAQPDTITVSTTVDQDGSLSTSSDRQVKNWGLRLYKDVIDDPHLIASVASGASLKAANLVPGTYIALQSDSTSWSVIGVSLNGGAAQASSADFQSITVGSGDNRTIQFIDTAPHLVINLGLTFFPETLIGGKGDTVRFVLDASQNAVQVSKATWDANGSTPNGGFSVPLGGGIAVLPDTGYYYYVCPPHVLSGMKGILRVPPPPPSSVTIVSIVDQDGDVSTANDRIGKNWSMKLYKDSVGSGVVVGSVTSSASLTVGNLAAGTYVALQADSSFWSVTGVSINSGAPQSYHSAQKSLTIAAGENDTITFLDYAPNTIISTGLAFYPDSILVFQGDAVHFVLDPTMHDAREVSLSTWNANGTTSNGGFDLPLGGGDVILSQSGFHYYICTFHADSGMKGRIFVSNATPFHINALAGWNMLSLPAQVPNNHVNVLYPTASSNAFVFQGIYVQRTTLPFGTGYWLKFATGQSVLMYGSTVHLDTLAVQPGWNMIGALSVAVPRAALNSIPPGILNGSVYGYSGAYFVADSLKPVYGYWVKSSSVGQVYLNSSSIALQAAPVVHQETASGRAELVFQDALGRTATLFVNEGGALRTDLPPVPPEGAFDIRYKSNESTGMSNGNATPSCPIQLQSVSYPVTVTYDGRALQHSVSLSVDDRMVDMHRQGSYRIVTPIRSLGVQVNDNATRPLHYALEQPFPNPFNPTTVIRFQLPVQSRILIRSYNVLGQVVALLKDGVEQAGVTSLTWNADNLGSGMYFIRLDAQGTGDAKLTYSQVVKVVLQK